MVLIVSIDKSDFLGGGVGSQRREGYAFLSFQFLLNAVFHFCLQASQWVGYEAQRKYW